MVRSGLAGGVEWAGYAPAESCKDALEAAKPAPVRTLRTVRLASDAQRGRRQARRPGSVAPVRAGQFRRLADALAADLHRWSRECVVF